MKNYFRSSPFHAAALVLIIFTSACASGGSSPARVSTAPLELQPVYPFSVSRSGTGRAMILIPGLLSSGEVWKATAAHFQPRYDVHVLTLAGFGGVRPLSNSVPFLETERDAIIRYIRERKLDRPVIVGHSLGGFLAFSVASRAPGVVGPIVAIDGVPYISALGDSLVRVDTIRPQAQRVATMYASMTPQLLEAQTRLGLPSMIRDSVNIAMAARWAGLSDPSTAGRAVAEMLTTDLRKEVAAIETPVLLVGGFGLAGTEPMREFIRKAYNAQVARIPRREVIFSDKARHFIMLDEPAWLHSAMDAFLAGAAAR